MPGLNKVLLGLGNPLLDVSVNVDQALLDKYELKMPNQILAEQQHVPLYRELAEKPDVEYMAGGATQNSMRVAQWMLQIPGAVSYMGCIGKDEFGKKMEETARSQGVRVQYQIDEEAPTGACAVCILGKERSLVANLAAANNFKISHVQKPENWALVEAARVIYSAGFFITVSPDTMMLTAQHCADNDKIYATNLSAAFISQVPPFKKVLLDLLPLTDFLFGNEDEAAAFAESEGWKDITVPEIALKISRMPKTSGCRPRTVVITQGSLPTIVASHGKTTEYPVQQLPAEKLVDTNGAGDAFVAGFLSQLVVGKDVVECVRAGHYAASTIIQHSGCNFPKEPNFVWI